MTASDGREWSRTSRGKIKVRTCSAEVIPGHAIRLTAFLFCFFFLQWRFEGTGKGEAKTRAASFVNLASQAASGRWKAFKSVVTWRITNTAERANHRPPVLWRSLKNYSASACREQTALCLNFHPAPAIHPAHCESKREGGTMKEALFSLRVIEHSTPPKLPIAFITWWVMPPSLTPRI